MNRELNNNGINNTSDANTSSNFNNNLVNNQNVNSGIEVNQIPNFNNQTINDNVSTNTEILNFYNEPVNNQSSPNTINNDFNQNPMMQNQSNNINMNNKVSKSPVISPVSDPVNPSPVANPNMNNISNDNNPINTEESPVENQTDIPQYEEGSLQFEEVNVKKPVARTDSYFDGGLLELIGWKILAGLITIITVGIARPWAKCMIYSWQFKHTVYNGKRLKFEGTGGDLFVQYFKWILLSIITLGIYLFFIPVSKTKWVISNLHFEDENLIRHESYFDGNTFELIGINILCALLNLISLGLLYTFTVCFKLKWINKHTVINKKMLYFNGHAINLFGKYILWIFLTIITFGIFGLWIHIKMLKWQSKNIHIKVVGEQEVKDNSFLIAIPIAILGIILFFAFIPSALSKVGGIEGALWNLYKITPMGLINEKNVVNPERYKYYDGDSNEVSKAQVYRIGY